jgi:hypothetical protein
MKDNGHRSKNGKTEHKSSTGTEASTPPSRDVSNQPGIRREPESNVSNQQSRKELPQREGTHIGKGPKSYRRSDDRILEEISDHMCDNPYLNASEIDVAVNNCEVVLTGIVEDRQSKRLAEDIAEAVSGVENVENRLRVRLRGI